MRAEDLVFWIDALPDREPDRGVGGDDVPGVLCERHADTMVVPRGWTLDDLRDPDLHLFRPPQLAPQPRVELRRASRRDHAGDQTGEQLRLGVDVEHVSGTGEASEAEGASVDGAETVEPTVPGPWTPSFDEADDLDGLLSARSPLLARAFRTATRNRP